MTAGRVNIGATSINGVAQEFEVETGSISANDFIQFAEEDIGVISSGSFTGETDLTLIDACYLDSERQLVVYRAGTNIKAFVWHIGVAYTKGVTYIIASDAYYLTNLKAVTVGTDKVAIIFNNASGVRCYIITINSRSITTHGGNTLNNATMLDAAYVSTDTLLITEKTSSSTQITKCSISTYTVSVNSTTVISNVLATKAITKRYDSNAYISIIKASTGVYVSMFKYSSNTLIKMHEARLVDTSEIIDIALETYGDNKAVVLYNVDTITYMLDLRLSDVAVIVRSLPVHDVKINNISCVNVKDNIFDIFYKRDTGAGYGCKSRLHLTDNAVFASETVMFENAVSSTRILVMPSGKYTLVVSGDLRVFGKAYTPNIKVRKAPSYNKINGIAKSSGSTGEIIRVVSI